MNQEIQFTEDQWWRIINRLNCYEHQYFSQLKEKRTDEMELNVLDAIYELKKFAYELYKKFGDQFHHSLGQVRKVCPNPSCKSVYAYFWEDWEYCPKCGAKLDITYDRKTFNHEENEKGATKWQRRLKDSSAMSRKVGTSLRT